ncbi:MAG: cysteine desulfurase [Gammaproteobacteria bacterium]|nr:cysteine desulfurase [Gammaproteobacteria bacterium]
MPNTAFDVQKIRQDFPILHQQVHGKPLAYLDNAASAQRPQCVIDAVCRYETHDHANVHRGVHTLSERATQAYENAREKVRSYINAASVSECVYVRGTTEAINLVANAWGQNNVKAGDEILISWMEHHSNIVPWQMLCARTGAKLVVAPITPRGEIDMEKFAALLSDRTRLVAVGHISNALGTVNPIRDIIALAHDRDIPVLIDGAQAMPHTRVDVQDLDVDFYAFSGHKMFAPTGIGVLYAKTRYLERMPPYQGGGEMILAVNFERSVYNELPYKFEAGTPNIAGAVGLGAAIDYLGALDFAALLEHEQHLLDYATEQLSSLSGIRLIGTARKKASVVSFVLENIHAHDLGTIVDSDGVAIRTGHHCAMPVMDYFEVPATARASFAFYNTVDEIDALTNALKKAQRMFA